jgi:hypothetical protein
MNRKAPGSGDELRIPMDGKKIDRPPHGVAFKQAQRRRAKRRRRSWGGEDDENPGSVACHSPGMNSSGILTMVNQGKEKAGE